MLEIWTVTDHNHLINFIFIFSIFREMKLPRDYARSSGHFPNVSLHITDVKGLDKEVVNLGELLKIQVRMDNEGKHIRSLINF